MSADKFIVSTNSRDAKSDITRILALRKFIGDRDIGDFVGIPVTEYVRASPHTIRLTVIYSSNKTPPFQGKGVKQAIYNIPDLLPTNADWKIIKAAAGGESGYMWGRFRSTANLSNGRQAAVYGNSKRSAEERLKALLKLSSAKILTISTTEELKEGLREQDKILYKEATRMYPAYFAILSSEKIINESNKELTLPFGTKNDNLSGTFRRVKTTKLPLWTKTEPSNIKPFIREMLKNRATNNNKKQ